MDPSECDRMLKPLLRPTPETLEIQALMASTKKGLAHLLPLVAHEAAFIEALWEKGEIQPDHLTPDLALQAKIQAMPALQWKAQHVRKHRGS